MKAETLLRTSRVPTATPPSTSQQTADIPITTTIPATPPPTTSENFSSRFPRSKEGYHCFACNQPGHFADECPKATCRTCNQKGHQVKKYPKAQPATSSNQVPVVQHVSKEARDNTPSSMNIFAKLRISGRWVTADALLDSGTEVNLIHPRLLHPLDKDRLGKATGVSALFNATTETLGSCDILTQIRNSLGVSQRQRPRFLVADIRDLDVILGYPWLYDVNPLIS
jgi:Zinc knuckle